MTNHLSEEELILHYYGEIARADEARLDQHLVECRECQAATSQLHRVLALVETAAPVAARPGFERDVWARLEPHHGLRLAFEIEFDHPAVRGTGQQVAFEMGAGNYKREIARARTFGFAQEIDLLRSRGLGLGGSLDNVIVVDETKVLNPSGLRYDDEFVKHKILDAIGDLMMAGRPMLASYTAFKSGHALNNRLVRTLVDDPEAWETVTFEDEARAPAGLAELAPAW